VKRRAKILIGVVLALGIGWLLLLMISHKNARDKVAAYKQELRAKGEKLTFAEIAPPASTRMPNGAGAFTKATNFSYSYLDYPQVMVSIGPGVARIGHASIRAELMFNYASNVQRAAEWRTILTNAAVLDFNPDYSKGFDLFLPQLAKLKTAEVVFSSTAMQALYQRDYSEAWPDLCAAADVVRLFENEPIVISSLVRGAMVRIAIPATWEALQDEHWTDSQIAELQAKWEDVDLFKLAELTVAVERAGVIDFLAAARKSHDHLQLFASFGSPPASSSAKVPASRTPAAWPRSASSQRDSSGSPPASRLRRKLFFVGSRHAQSSSKCCRMSAFRVPLNHCQTDVVAKRTTVREVL